MFAQNTVATLNQASAFSRIRQRSDRRKKESMVSKPAAAIKRHWAATIVSHTTAQLTPRNAKYSRTAASTPAITHDHAFRAPAVAETASGVWMLALLFHEVVPDHMQHDHV